MSSHLRLERGEKRLSRGALLCSPQLTVRNSASSEVGSKYCDAQVAAEAEDYCLGRDESPGQWRGSGASA